MSTLMIPFNNQPVETIQLNCSPNSTASYNIPAGKYARVYYLVTYGAYFNVNESSVALSSTTSDYASPSAADPIQIGWQGFNDSMDCGVGAGASNSSTYTFDAGYIYSNVSNM